MMLDFSKITPKMTEAGVAALCNADLRDGPYWEIVESIFKAMTLARTQEEIASIVAAGACHFPGQHSNLDQMNRQNKAE